MSVIECNWMSCGAKCRRICFISIGNISKRIAAFNNTIASKHEWKAVFPSVHRILYANTKHSHKTLLCVDKIYVIVME